MLVAGSFPDDVTVLPGGVVLEQSMDVKGIVGSAEIDTEAGSTFVVDLADVSRCVSSKIFGFPSAFHFVIG